MKLEKARLEVAKQAANIEKHRATERAEKKKKKAAKEDDSHQSKLVTVRLRLGSNPHQAKSNLVMMKKICRTSDRGGIEEGHNIAWEDSVKIWNAMSNWNSTKKKGTVKI